MSLLSSRHRLVALCHSYRSAIHLHSRSSGCITRSYHGTGAVYASSDIMNATDYGKYYQPSFFENLLTSYADSSLVQGMESLLIHTQDFTGLPWWSTVVLFTIALRGAITLPLFVWQLQKSGKRQMVDPLLRKVAEKLTLEGDEAAKKQNWDARTRDVYVTRSYLKHEKAVLRQHKIPNMYLTFIVPWVQLPLWFTLSTALRDLTLTLPVIGQVPHTSLVVYQALSAGGTLWFSNLCSPDATMILPVLAGVTNLAIIEVHRGDGKTPLTPGIKVLVNVLRAVSVSMIPIGFYMPSGVVLYWVSSSAFGLCQALMVRSARVKKFLRIPVPSNHSKTPYKDILSRFRFKK